MPLKHIALSLLTCTFVMAIPANGSTSASDEATTIVKRVGGDRDVETELKRGAYRCGDLIVDTALPKGYPRPTPEGAIELKRYPGVRRAEFTGTTDPDRGGRTAGFWPLFQHIKQREIAMTSPVEMDYPGLDPSAGDSGGWTMSFLYRTPDLGPVGDAGDVTVVDTEPITVLSIGLRGPYGMDLVDHGLRRLEEWLAGQNDWKQAGPPRSLYYNGPSVPERRKWAEVQIPVERVSEQAKAPGSQL